MINRAVLTGRMTRDVELRYTQSGVAAGSFTLAVGRNFKNANNERESDFINCVIWRKSAENFASFTHKGSLVGIDGRIQTRNYENKQGNRVYVTEVVVDDFALLDPRQHDSNGNSQRSGNGGNQYGNDSNGANAQYNRNSPASNQQDPFADSDDIDISDDQLPF